MVKFIFVIGKVKCRLKRADQQTDSPRIRHIGETIMTQKTCRTYMDVLKNPAFCAKAVILKDGELDVDIALFMNKGKY